MQKLCSTKMSSASLSFIAVAGVVGGGVYGSIEQSSATAALIASAFACVFLFALNRVQAAAPAPPQNQLPLVLLMIVLSFGLHVQYLPAGICCFFALMVTRNELLLPPPPPSQSEQQKQTKKAS